MERSLLVDRGIRRTLYCPVLAILDAEFEL
jgi:hypothetical protein